MKNLLFALCLVLAMTGCKSTTNENETQNASQEQEEKNEKVVNNNLEIMENGIKKEILKEGTGEAAKKGDNLRMHYTGTFTDGTKFDSSLDRNQPFAFTLGAGQVIQGWDEGIVGMKIGEKRKLTIPYQMAYGEMGMPPVIPPKSTLIFEVELLEIVKR